MVDNTIKKMYLEILHRPVDEHGLNHYKRLINELNWSVEQIKNDLNNSEEKRAFEIKSLYKKILFREADPDGFEFYLHSTFTIPEIKHLLENSHERNNEHDHFLTSYQHYYKHFPLKLSEREYMLSVDSLNYVNTFYNTHFERSLCNVNKYYYQLLYINNNKLVQPDLDNYLVRVNNGKSFIKENNVIICGLLRDKEKIIGSVKHRCYELVKLFNDYQILIVENDSSDNTRQRLLDWSKEDQKVWILGNGINANECKLDLPKTCTSKPATSDRIKKMSDLRNIYMDCIRDHFRHFNFIIVIDMDLDGDLYIDSICDSFYYLKNKNVDGITCSGFEKYHFHYYDSFAYVDIDNKYIWDSEKEKTDHDNYIFYHKTREFTRSMKIKKVLSAFGGFCIYQMNSIINLRYNYSPDKYSCEHAHLNVHLKNFYLNPRMVFAITDNS
jgi:hypothetical protein